MNSRKIFISALVLLFTAALLSAGRLVPLMAGLSVIPFLTLAVLVFFGRPQSETEPLTE